MINLSVAEQFSLNKYQYRIPKYMRVYIRECFKHKKVV